MIMYGLEAIAANNGWAICVVGISIVFSGLVALSILISRLHKILHFYENPGVFFQWPRKKISEDSQSHIPITSDQRTAVKQFSLLLNKMPSHFSLPRLLHLAQLRGIKEPHTHLSLLIAHGAVYPDHNGFFCWNEDIINQILLGTISGTKGIVQQ